LLSTYIPHKGLKDSLGTVVGIDAFLHPEDIAPLMFHAIFYFVEFLHTLIQALGEKVVSPGDNLFSILFVIEWYHNIVINDVGKLCPGISKNPLHLRAYKCELLRVYVYFINDLREKKWVKTTLVETTR